jgi:hypothetical protein
MSLQFDEFDVKDTDDISRRWTKYSTRLLWYLNTRKFEEEKLRIESFFLAAGYDLYEIYVTSYKNDNDKVEHIVQKLTEHFNPKSNIQLNQFNFRNLHQLEGEDFESFALRVRTAAKSCGFTDENSEVAAQIVQREAPITSRERCFLKKSSR